MFHCLHGRRHHFNNDCSNFYNAHPKEQRCIVFRHVSWMSSSHRWLRGICWHFEKFRHPVLFEMHYGTWDIPRGLSGIWEMSGRHLSSCSDSWKPTRPRRPQSHLISIPEQPKWIINVTIGFLATRREKIPIVYNVNKEWVSLGCS